MHKFIYFVCWILTYLSLPTILYTQIESTEKSSFQLVNASNNLPEVVLQKRNSMDAEVVDIDKDGDLDMIIAVEFYKNVILVNDGRGHFSDGSHMIPDKKAERLDVPYRYYPYHDSEDVAVEDFDRDGDLDIVIVTEDDKTNEYYLNNGQGSFDDVSATFPVDGVTNGVTAADLDGDGWIDLILANNGQDELLMNRQGKFVVETGQRMPLSDDITQDIEVADVENDGDLDLIIGNEHLSKIYINNGNCVFSDKTEQLFQGLDVRETREVDAGDIDGDGDLDLFLSNVLLFQKYLPVCQLLINDGRGLFTDETDFMFTLESETGYVDADLVDLDQDGDLDIILGGFGGPAIMINDGKGKFTDHTYMILKEQLNIIIIDVEIADFNGDGINDLYLSVFRNGDVLLLGRKS